MLLQHVPFLSILFSTACLILVTYDAGPSNRLFARRMNMSMEPV
jgi:hypothetical protein